MAVTLVSPNGVGSGSNASGATTIPVVIPSGVLAGDVLKLTFSLRTTISAAPSGWSVDTAASGSTNPVANTAEVYAYTKVALAGDGGATANFTQASFSYAYAIAAFRGGDQVAGAWDNSGANTVIDATWTAATTVTAGAYTTNSSGDMPIDLFGGNLKTAPLVTAPTGYTVAVDVANGAASTSARDSAIAYVTAGQATAGAVASQAFTLASSTGAVLYGALLAAVTALPPRGITVLQAVNRAGTY